MSRAPLTLRKYQPKDREGIRRLCVEVAVFGKPLDTWLDVDPEIFADIFTSYYTDYEPQSTYVAISEGRVVAYLALCTDTRRSERFLNYIILPRCAVKILSGRYRLGWKWIPLVWYSILEMVKYGKIHLPIAEYPAHFHLNIAPKFRRDRRLWLQVVPTFLKHALENGATRVHGLGITKRGEFERTYANFGFKILKKQPCLIRRTVTKEEVFWLLIGADLNEWIRDLPPAFKRFFKLEEDVREVEEGV